MHNEATGQGLRLLAVLLLVSLPVLAKADDAVPTSAPALQWGGYGSLSLHRAAIRGATLRPDVQYAGSAQDGEWSTDGDSRLALQGRLALPAATEAVLQLSSSNTQDHHYRPRVDWAYLDWRPGAAATLRLGRQILPVLRHAESRNVGYAQAAVRPQPAVYVLSTGSPVDGANLSWELAGEQDTWRLDLGAGRSSAQAGGRRIDVRRSAVVALQWQRGPWTGRVAASEYRLDISGPSLASPALQAVCTNCAEMLGARASSTGVQGRLATLLLIWDDHPWEWSLEALWRPSSSSLLTPRAQGAYVQVSHRIGRWQWQAALGRLRYLERPLGLQPAAGAPAGAVATLEALDRYLQSPNDLTTAQLGLRVELGTGLALKLQHDVWRATRDRQTGRSGLILLASPPLGPTASAWNGRAGLTTLALDFLF